MEHYHVVEGPDGRKRLTVPCQGPQLLSHSMYNKSTGFTLEERAAFGLTGLLPDVVSTLAQQAERAYGNIVRKSDPLERYIGLAALQDRNEHQFYRVLVDHLEEFLPIVYTPTVGRACQMYSRIFRRARGLWVTPRHRGNIHEVLGHAPFADVRLIVVTDNESILGLGDQGAGGMGIPIGKLALYTAAAGIHPSYTLPISLDVGTDNEDLLKDELYIGWRGRRLRGEEYHSLVDEFVHAVKARFPRAILQWEDFRKGTAFALLERYRKVLPSFNDDIQGTAAMALAGILAGARILGQPLAQQRIVVVGAGAAGVGIARLLGTALQRTGLTEIEARERIALLDAHGLLVAGIEGDEPFRGGLAWPPELAAARGLTAGARDLLAVVRALRPTVLVGVSGAPGLFSEGVVREMARHVDRPMIFPLSNPNSLAEAQPKDLVAWTEGRALVASGSPFPGVEHGGRLLHVSQGNNAFIFPGVGLGALLAEVPEVTDEMFTVAAETLADQLRQEDEAEGALYPPVAALRQVTARIAAGVVREARRSGLGKAIADEHIPALVAEAMWEPAYLPLLPR